MNNYIETITKTLKRPFHKEEENKQLTPDELNINKAYFSLLKHICKSDNNYHHKEKDLILEKLKGNKDKKALKEFLEQETMNWSEAIDIMINQGSNKQIGKSLDDIKEIIKVDEKIKACECKKLEEYIRKLKNSKRIITEKQKTFFENE